jgi:hypothetical protein
LVATGARSGLPGGRAWPGREFDARRASTGSSSSSLKIVMFSSTSNSSGSPGVTASTGSRSARRLAMSTSSSSTAKWAESLRLITGALPVRIAMADAGEVAALRTRARLRWQVENSCRCLAFKTELGGNYGGILFMAAKVSI